MPHKKIRVFALPSHQEKTRTHGVDFARIIQPMKYLAKHPDFKVEIYDIQNKKYDVDAEKQMDWLNVTKNFDIIYLNYINNPWGYAAMGAMARRGEKKVKLVLDMDDALWNISSDNPAYKVYQKGESAIRNFTAICNDVDYITCTNPYLRNVITHNTMKYHEKIKILPNYIDLDLYSHRSKFKDTKPIVLMHFGSTTHFLDLLNENFVEGMDMIMKKYPNVIFKTVGANIGELKEMWGARYQNEFGHQDIYKWIKGRFRTFMDEADIIVTPLVDNLYNRCKSSIKFLEASSAKKPGVWQKIRQYEDVVDGTNGLLAASSQEWYEQMKKLIDDAELRQMMGEAAFQTIVDDWQIQNNIDKYVAFFKEIV